MNKATFYILVITLISVILVSCQSGKEGFIEVSNSSPKFKEKKYTNLEKLYDIDVTQINLFNKNSTQDLYRLIDFDENNNLYILDSFESIIWVFDENGKLVRSFGGKGQGPGEFISPNALVIKKDKIYVFQGHWGYKIVDLKGEYISSHDAFIENRLKLRSIGNDFYVLRAEADRTFTKLKFVLCVMDHKFSSGKDIFRYKYPPGFQGPYYNFSWVNWFLIIDSGEFYFPENNFSKYLIVKYTKEGEPILKFGRKYQLKNYSKEARERFYSMYEKQIEEGQKVFPKNPPVVRNMFQDERENIWVISGETYEDNMNSDYENTIDIFNKKGKWLQSFTTKLISRYIIYNNGKIYRILPISVDNYDQYIEVYKIKYLN